MIERARACWSIVYACTCASLVRKRKREEYKEREREEKIDKDTDRARQSTLRAGGWKKGAAESIGSDSVRRLKVHSPRECSD